MDINSRSLLSKSAQLEVAPAFVQERDQMMLWLSYLDVQLNRDNKEYPDHNMSVSRAHINIVVLVNGY